MTGQSFGDRAPIPHDGPMRKSDEHTTESPSLWRAREISRFRLRPLPEMDLYHFIPVNVPSQPQFLSTKGFIQFLSFTLLWSLFAREYLVLYKISHPSYAIAETVIVPTMLPNASTRNRLPLRTHSRQEMRVPLLQLL